MDDSRERFKMGLIAIAQKVEVALTLHDVETYLQILEPYGFDAAVKALRELFIEVKPGRRLMPSVGDILRKLGVGEIDKDKAAADLTAKILGLAHSRGVCRTREDVIAIRSEVTEVGWHAVIKGYAHWNNFAESLTYLNEASRRQELRAVIWVALYKVESGLDINKHLPGMLSLEPQIEPERLAVGAPTEAPQMSRPKPLNFKERFLAMRDGMKE